MADDGPRFRVELSVDGRRVPLKAFIHDVVGGAVHGMVSGLEGCDAAGAIELRVVRRGARDEDDGAADPR